MRRLMLFTLGFLLAALLLVLCFQGLFWLLPLGLLLPCVALFFCRGKLRAVAVVLLGAVIGGLFTCAYTQRNLYASKKLCGKEISVTLRAEGYPISSRYGHYVEVSLTEPEAPLSGMLYYSQENATIAPGDSITTTAVLEQTYELAADGELYYPSKGIGFRIFPKAELTVAPAQKRTLRQHMAVFSQTLKKHIQVQFPDASSGYFMALTTGDKSGLDYTFRNQMSLCGLYHAVSLSGMHVAILMGAILLLCGHRRRLAALLGVPSLVLFLLLSGGNASTARAVWMQSILFLTAFVPREYDPLTSLSAALLVLMLENPWCIAQWGLQLSFLSTAGILLLAPRLLKAYYKRRPKGKLLRRLLDVLVSSLTVTVSATVFTLPLMVIYFGLVSLVAPVTNLLCLWSVTLSFIGGILFSLMAMLSPALAGFLAVLLHWLYVYLHQVVALFSKLPMAAVYHTQPYLMAWGIGLYLFVVLLFFQKKRQYITALCMTLSLALCLVLHSATTVKDGFTVLSVGQGQSIVCTKDAHTYLIDCGGDGEESGEIAARYLLSRGIRRIDGIILTHFDSDHTVGLLHFLTRVQSDYIYYTAESTMTEQVQALLQAAEQRGTRPQPVTDISLPLGQGSLQLFSAVDGENDNDTGLCILAETQEYDILITGDLSQEGELRLLQQHHLPRVDVLVAGHHGSASSNSQALLDTVCPGTVLISVGENPYGHPAPKALRRMAAAGAAIYTTLKSGNLTVRW